MAQMNEKMLLSIAKNVGDDWKESAYYDEAERCMNAQWRSLIWPIIKNCDFSCVVDLAAGHGRNTEKLRHLAKKVYVVDINEENVEFLKRRFSAFDNIVCLQNDGISLKRIRSSEVTLVYSFDAMVHFDSDVVRAYLKEFQRVLKPGGYGFCHYSNYTEKPTSNFRETTHWRNFMSRELFEHYAWKEGLLPIKSELQDWHGSGQSVDCATLFQKPFEPVNNHDHSENEDTSGLITILKSFWRLKKRPF